MRAIQLRYQLSKIFALAIFWMIAGLFFSLIERAYLGNATIYPNTGNPYSFPVAFASYTLGTFAGGLIFVSFEVFVFYKFMQRRSFGSKLLVKSSLYLLMAIAFVLLNAAVYNAVENELSFFSADVWNRVFDLVSKFIFLVMVCYLAILIVTSIFLLQVNDKFGKGTLLQLFTGKYHRPTEETRIFMFLDLKSSTWIAEELGHIQFFNLLNQFFSDITSPIVRHLGEIYQYVGDEIVISWTMENGTRNANCVNCFFAIEDCIRELRGTYMDLFNLVPEFKAGLHYGKVTTGEIGIMKTEIIFTGDVLNTTSRIQAECNRLNAKLLISSELLELLSFEDRNVDEIGDLDLRGKKEPVKLFRIS